MISQELWYANDGKVAIESDAPLELIKARSNKLEGVLKVSENTFAFRLETATIRGFNSPLQQEHFHENYMESTLHPTASFAGKFIEDISALAPGTHEVRAKGKLDIHGVSVERIIKCEVIIGLEKLSISSGFIVPLQDHNIRIPQVVHQKIAEEIQVAVAIELTPR